MNNFKDTLVSKLNALEVRRSTMYAALKVKMEEQDMHGTADFAMDIRDIDAEMKALMQMLTQIEKSDGYQS